ncbi:lysophospholipase L1-like esterase [Microbacterium sp. SLBN-154]|uniref:SGNH/GDSL hydrolase family protein n=1 Tax=Microbacterium sp. SLBN-154 TaxID=2768458 RepID=UPI001171CB7D|nr:SGNH/GDSL hydrolase family protein [Microbacterium sp. SLBN-154]TQK19118.1 lysophospholipase L1-like esterase [Microbacterium sp. SLBN-154]
MPRVLAPRLSSRGRLIAAVLALAVAVGAVAAVAGIRAWLTPPPAPPVAVAAPEDAVVQPAPLVLPDDPRILVFGDSWTFGSAASDPSLGYAYQLADRLGAEVVVDGVRGSGYLKPGLDGGSFGERVAALDPSLDPDLVILQGSINDRRLYPAGYREAVTAVWDALSATYPDATVVILGPAPQVLPVETATAQIDDDLAALAAERGWWYVSPIDEEWIGEANYDAVIDTGIGRDHPSTEGHAYLADRVADAVRMLGEGADVVADAPVDEDVVAP